MNYDRNAASAYAHRWAYRRNPAYYNFDSIGGDCTNFISQCLYAGCGVMNYTRDLGWYYKSANNRAAAWTGVQYLYKFLTTNRAAGPYAFEASPEGMMLGDIVQLSFDGNVYTHSLLVVYIEPTILLATHSQDVDNRPLNTYQYKLARFLHIEGVKG